MRRVLFSVVIKLTIFFSLALVTSCGNKSMSGMVILTRASNVASFPEGHSWRYKAQSQLIAITPGETTSNVKLLTKDFYSAVSPQVSFDGKHILFSARKLENDPWQIWEMDLTKLKTKQITTSAENCTDPAYLPNGQVVFSMASVNDSLKAGSVLFTCNPDGTFLRRITFNPHSYSATTVLKDGRLLTKSTQVYPSPGEPLIMIMRPDGTKSELFFESQEGKEIQSLGVETSDGRIVFIEENKIGNKKLDLVSISYNRPLHSYSNITGSVEGNFYSFSALPSGKLMVCYQPSDNSRIALYEFDAQKNSIGKSIYESNEYDILESVEIGEHEKPKKLPSEVDMGVKTGQLLCQNINVTELDALGTNMAFEKADRIEIIGIDSSLGVVNVQNDGSFYLKVAADMPFTLKTLNAAGKVINGPGRWIWLRPNERRGCVGCHEDHEMVPGNIQPVAVKFPPVSIPVIISVVKEKEVELE